MKLEPITIPDLGGAEEVEVIEVSVAAGAQVAVDQPLITLESDKASMEIPSPRAGTVSELKLKVGDRVKSGDLILMLAAEGEAAAAPAPAPAATAAPEPAPPAPAAAPATPDAPPVERRSTPRGPVASGGGPEHVVTVPDLGGAANVEVIEITVRAGDHVAEGAALLVMEGDKASMELPSPVAGTVQSIEVRVGAQIASGQRIAVLRIDPSAKTPTAPSPAPAEPAPAPAAVTAPAAASPPATMVPASAEGDSSAAIARVLEKEGRLPGAARREAERPASPYAGPAVRQLARELGVMLEELRGSGPKGRILKEDVHAWVKSRLSAPKQAAAGFSLPPVPEVDFSVFGAIDTVALGNIQRATVTSMSRSWLNVPHVTQFDYADVHDLEEFRDSLKPEMESRGNKLTPLPFLLLGCARALREYPRFASSLAPDGAQLVLKKYCHIGIAVDTPQGLVVPVIRDVDRKSVWDLSTEARELAAKARARKLKIGDMQGAVFTISSLGNIGGEGFTPIVNTPEVAILGVSRLAIRPVWDGKQFQPRKTLPLSLSYDHRVVNGADAGNFLTFLVGLLGDLRRLVL